VEHIKRRMAADILPCLGPRPIAEIEAPELVSMANAIQDRGALDIAKRALETVGQIFRYSIAHGYSKRTHLAEQLALKALVPVVALSGDKKLTSTRVPWIFRLPVETNPATALRLLKTAAIRSGANSERLRDVLASKDDISEVAFLPTGEPRGQ